MPKIKTELIASIIVPTLNEQDNIVQTLEALSNQTIARNKYELIVSDSSSEDLTVGLAKKYADKVVVCKRHSAGYGRNNGALHADGKYLGFVDADTVVANTWIEGLIESLENGVGSTGPMESLEKDSTRMNLFYKWWSLQSKQSIKVGYPIFPGFNIGVRKESFDRIGGFVLEDITTEDIELGLSLKKLGKIVFNEKMHVKTSTRKMREIPMIPYAWNGARYILFKKSRPWKEHRKDFEVGSKMKLKD